MPLGISATALLGSLAFWWGMRFGRVMVRKGATANDLFRGKTWASLAFLGLYILFMLLALHIPQLQTLPVEIRVYGMEITWTVMRVVLLGICGATFIVSWFTARPQIIAVLLIGVLGLWGFTSAEAYFLAPIHGQLEDNLRPNGVFQQTSSSSCAPAALATVLHRWGLDATESTVAQLADTNRLGTSMAQLIVAARKYRMDGVELNPTWEQMRQINRPGVLATWLYNSNGKQAHAVALVGMTEDVAAIADPAFGRIFYVPRSQFLHIWRNQYVPIFRPTDKLLAPEKAASYLQSLGLLDGTISASQPGRSSSTSEVDPQALDGAVRRFQKQTGIKPTGELDPQTVLLLSGPFLEDVPTLEIENSSL